MKVVENGMCESVCVRVRVRVRVCARVCVCVVLVQQLGACREHGRGVDSLQDTCWMNNKIEGVEQ